MDLALVMPLLLARAVAVGLGLVEHLMLLTILKWALVLVAALVEVVVQFLLAYFLFWEQFL
jgi:hypothetical protein